MRHRSVPERPYVPIKDAKEESIERKISVGKIKLKSHAIPDCLFGGAAAKPRELSVQSQGVRV